MNATSEDILSYWFGEPADDAASLAAKIRRWYQSGELLDGELRARFGVTVEQALAGKLDGWKATPRGRLALILLLDQMTRHVFRGTPRQHAGDAAALLLAREALVGQEHRLLGAEERLFLIMPFAHSESRDMQRVSVALAADLVASARPEQHEVWEEGMKRALRYQAIIERFGRFPHRNQVLGRASTAEERRFLEAADA